MPDWFQLIGIVIATAAAIIASQALISGSFTLVSSRAMRLNLWPKMRMATRQKNAASFMFPASTSPLFQLCRHYHLFQKSHQHGSGLRTRDHALHDRHLHPLY